MLNVTWGPTQDNASSQEGPGQGSRDGVRERRRRNGGSGASAQAAEHAHKGHQEQKGAGRN